MVHESGAATGHDFDQMIPASIRDDVRSHRRPRGHWPELARSHRLLTTAAQSVSAMMLISAMVSRVK
jgi:hypothetical protein